MRRSRDPSEWAHDRCQAAGILLGHDVILLARGDGRCADEWIRAGERTSALDPLRDARKSGIGFPSRVGVGPFKPFSALQLPPCCDIIEMGVGSPW